MRRRPLSANAFDTCDLASNVVSCSVRSISLGRRGRSEKAASVVLRRRGIVESIWRCIRYHSIAETTTQVLAASVCSPQDSSYIFQYDFKLLLVFRRTKVLSDTQLTFFEHLRTRFLLFILEPQEEADSRCTLVTKKLAHAQ